MVLETVPWMSMGLSKVLQFSSIYLKGYPMSRTFMAYPQDKCLIDTGPNLISRTGFAIQLSTLCQLSCVQKSHRSHWRVTRVHLSVLYSTKQDEDPEDPFFEDRFQRLDLHLSDLWHILWISLKCARWECSFKWGLAAILDKTHGQTWHRFGEGD